MKISKFAGVLACLLLAGCGSQADVVPAKSESVTSVSKSASSSSDVSVTEIFEKQYDDVKNIERTDTLSNTGSVYSYAGYFNYEDQITLYLRDGDNEMSYVFSTDVISPDFLNMLEMTGSYYYVPCGELKHCVQNDLEQWDASDLAIYKSNGQILTEDEIADIKAKFEAAKDTDILEHVSIDTTCDLSDLELNRWYVFDIKDDGKPLDEYFTNNSNKTYYLLENPNTTSFSAKYHVITNQFVGNKETFDPSHYEICSFYLGETDVSMFTEGGPLYADSIRVSELSSESIQPSFDEYIVNDTDETVIVRIGVLNNESDLILNAGEIASIDWMSVDYVRI